MPRYIDAETLEKDIDAAQDQLMSNDDDKWRVNKPYYKGLAWARTLLNEQPSANVVEVVRCSGCNHFLPCESGDEGYCIQMMRGMPNNGFCNYGKKEES